MNINQANQGNSQGNMNIPGNMNNTGISGGGVGGVKTNPGNPIGGLSQPGNGGPGNMNGQNIPPQNKDDKS